MGWKASVIFVQHPGRTDPGQLLGELGYTHLSRIDDKPLDAVIDPPDSRLYIGLYEDVLLLCVPDLPEQLIEGNAAEAQARLRRVFPDSETCAILLHSGVNLWGYSISRNGRAVRAMGGCSGKGTFLEEGTPLPEEQDVLGRSRRNAAGERVYFSDDFPGEELTEDQMGEELVFSISKRYLGERLDCLEELFEVVLTGFSFGIPAESPPAAEQSVATRAETDAMPLKPWWKFW